MLKLLTIFLRFSIFLISILFFVLVGIVCLEKMSQCCFPMRHLLSPERTVVSKLCFIITKKIYINKSNIFEDSKFNVFQVTDPNKRQNENGIQCQIKVVKFSGLNFTYFFEIKSTDMGGSREIASNLFLKSFIYHKKKNAIFSKLCSPIKKQFTF